MAGSTVGPRGPDEPDESLAIEDDRVVQMSVINDPDAPDLPDAGIGASVEAVFERPWRLRPGSYDGWVDRLEHLEDHVDVQVLERELREGKFDYMRQALDEFDGNLDLAMIRMLLPGVSNPGVFFSNEDLRADYMTCIRPLLLFALARVDRRVLARQHLMRKAERHVVRREPFVGTEYYDNAYVVAVDVADFTALKGTLGDRGTAEFLRNHLYPIWERLRRSSEFAEMEFAQRAGDRLVAFYVGDDSAVPCHFAEQLGRELSVQASMDFHPGIGQGDLYVTVGESGKVYLGGTAFHHAEVSEGVGRAAGVRLVERSRATDQGTYALDEGEVLQSFVVGGGEGGSSPALLATVGANTSGAMSAPSGLTVQALPVVEAGGEAPAHLFFSQSLDEHTSDLADQLTRRLALICSTASPHSLFGARDDNPRAASVYAKLEAPLMNEDHSGADYQHRLLTFDRLLLDLCRRYDAELHFVEDTGSVLVIVGGVGHNPVGQDSRAAEFMQGFVDIVRSKFELAAQVGARSDEVYVAHMAGATDVISSVLDASARLATHEDATGAFRFWPSMVVALKADGFELVGERIEPLFLKGLSTSESDKLSVVVCDALCRGGEMPPIFGMNEDLDRVMACVDEEPDGNHHFSIESEPGMGTSLFIRHAVARLEASGQSIRLLQLPEHHDRYDLFGGMAQVLNAVFPRERPKEFERWLDSEQGRSPDVPLWKRMYHELVLEPPSEGVSLDPRPVREAFVRLVARLANYSGVVLVCENIDQLDEPSREAFFQLLREAHPKHALFLFTTGTRAEDATSIALRGIDPEAMSELVAYQLQTDVSDDCALFSLIRSIFGEGPYNPSMVRTFIQNLLNRGLLSVGSTELKGEKEDLAALSFPRGIDGLADAVFNRLERPEQVRFVGMMALLEEAPQGAFGLACATLGCDPQLLNDPQLESIFSFQEGRGGRVFFRQAIYLRRARGREMFQLDSVSRQKLADAFDDEVRSGERHYPFPLDFYSGVMIRLGALGRAMPTVLTRARVLLAEGQPLPALLALRTCVGALPSDFVSLDRQDSPSAVRVLLELVGAYFHVGDTAQAAALLPRIRAALTVLRGEDLTQEKIQLAEYECTQHYLERNLESFASSLHGLYAVLDHKAEHPRVLFQRGRLAFRQANTGLIEQRFAYGDRAIDFLEDAKAASVDERLDFQYGVERMLLMAKGYRLLNLGLSRARLERFGDRPLTPLHKVELLDDDAGQIPDFIAGVENFMTRASEHPHFFDPEDLAFLKLTLGQAYHLAFQPDEAQRVFAEVIRETEEAGYLISLMRALQSLHVSCVQSGQRAYLDNGQDREAWNFFVRGDAVFRRLLLHEGSPAGSSFVQTARFNQLEALGFILHMGSLNPNASMAPELPFASLKAQAASIMRQMEAFQGSSPVRGHDQETLFTFIRGYM